MFSTKDRQNLIPESLRTTLWRYFAGIGRNRRTPVISAGGTANHVHLLIALPSDIPLAKAIQVLKANSSRWIGEHGIRFAWQEGYGAFSASSSNVATVKEYIQHQEDHHGRRSYEEEFVAFLRKSGVSYDPSQVFG